jgi:hypothetical protein
MGMHSLGDLTAPDTQQGSADGFVRGLGDGNHGAAPRLGQSELPEVEYAPGWRRAARSAERRIGDCKRRSRREALRSLIPRVADVGADRPAKVAARMHPLRVHDLERRPHHV